MLALGFIAGLIADLFLGRSFGVSSLLFLGLALEVYGYKSKVAAENWWSVAGGAAILSWQAHLIWGMRFTPGKVVVEAGVGLLCWWFYKWRQGRRGKREVYLKR